MGAFGSAFTAGPGACSARRKRLLSDRLCRTKAGAAEPPVECAIQGTFHPQAGATPHPDFWVVRWAGVGSDRLIARRRWRFDGRVQGVGFRAFCETAAAARNVRGWVRNEFDGSVSVEAEAEMDVLSEFFQHLLKGHLSARVDRSEETPLASKNDLSEGFAIR